MSLASAIFFFSIALTSYSSKFGSIINWSEILVGIKFKKMGFGDHEFSGDGNDNTSWNIFYAEWNLQRP